MSDLYRIDYTAEDYLTDAMVKRFIDKAVGAFVLVPVAIDCEAAETVLTEWVDDGMDGFWSDAAEAIVDASLGGN